MCPLLLHLLSYKYLPGPRCNVQRDQRFPSFHGPLPGPLSLRYKRIATSSAYGASRHPPASRDAESGAIGHASRSFLFIKFIMKMSKDKIESTAYHNMIRHCVLERPAHCRALPVIRWPSLEGTSAWSVKCFLESFEESLPRQS